MSETDAVPPRLVGKRGKLPNNPDAPRLTLTTQHLAALSAVLPELPISPLIMDDLSAVAQRAGGFPWYGNNKIGDCVLAALGHAIQVFTLLGSGTEITVPDQAIFDAYSAITGWNPTDPSTDRGTVIQDALHYWRTVGIAKHRIAAYAQVPLHNRALLEAALNIFGVAIVGVSLPQSAEDQFARHEQWTTVDGSLDVGGHCVLAGAYQQISATDVVPEVVTWADVQSIADEWWENNVDEVWVVFTREWCDAVGLSPRGIALAALGRDFQALTGDPNPFKPAPTTPQDALETFLPAAQAWLHETHVLPENRAFAKSLMAYLHGTGVLPG